MFTIRVNLQPNSPAGLGTKLFASLFGLVFMGMGLLFVGLIVRDAISRAQTWTWQKTDCVISASDVAPLLQPGQSADEFHAEVKYHYTFGGQEFTSDRYERRRAGIQDYGKAARLAQKYRPGAQEVCYVNPTAPAEAILVRSPFLLPELFFLLLGLIPMIFVAVGGAIIHSAWRGNAGGGARARPISSRAAPDRIHWLLFPFFTIFLVAGLGAFHGLFLRSMLKVQSAKSWPAVPCVVLSSRVGENTGGRSTTYWINILYSYEFQGREHRANAYGFMGGSSSGYAGKEMVVRQHPPGTKTVCYVNPSEPTEAVLNRGLTADMWFGLLPLTFGLVGAGGLVFTVRLRRQNATAAGGVAGAHAPGGMARAPAASVGGVPTSLVLKPALSPWGKLFVALFVCLFWNGIVSVFVTMAVQSWRAGSPQWGLMLFLVPFVTVGLGAVAWVAYSFMALLNPRPRLTVTPGAVSLGGTLQVQWQLGGRVGVVKSLRLRLEGREEATFTRGTNSQTDKSVFADIELARANTLREVQSGKAIVTIPAGLVPSFTARHNKIIWAIHVHGEIAWWPDVKEEFPVTVLPSAPSTRPPL